MCTISIVPVDVGFRLMCNRDERMARPVAEGPRRVNVAGMEATFPADPRSGGTWIGVNEAGLTVALLNRTANAVNRDALAGAFRAIEERSRGDIVPRLLGARDMPHLLEAVRAIDPTPYRPFRVVGVWRHELLVATTVGRCVTVELRQLIRPVAFTSSSLDDATAERLRLPLFDALVANAVDPIVPQRVFHGHQWDHCPQFSVRMRRADACTVSRSTVNVTLGHAASLEYEPLHPHVWRT